MLLLLLVLVLLVLLHACGYNATLKNIELVQCERCMLVGVHDLSAAALGNHDFDAGLDRFITLGAEHAHSCAVRSTLPCAVVELKLACLGEHCSLAQKETVAWQTNYWDMPMAAECLHLIDFYKLSHQHHRHQQQTYCYYYNNNHYFISNHNSI
jgi:hypothetical protein